MVNKSTRKFYIPQAYVKEVRTSNFQSSGSTLSFGGPGNEGLDVLEWINQRISDGDIVLSGLPDVTEMYFDDEDASNNGIDIGSAYWLSDTNIYGAPGGTLKIRMA